MFGAKVGDGVVVKPGVNIKYPWNLEIGAHSWIGEKVWIDSLTRVTIGCHACISQGVYLCTGNHDWSDPEFGLITKSITVKDGVWIGAKAIVLPGVTLASNSVITAGAVVTQNTETGMVYSGSPANPVRNRNIKPQV